MGTGTTLTSISQSKSNKKSTSVSSASNDVSKCSSANFIKSTNTKSLSKSITDTKGGATTELPSAGGGTMTDRLGTPSGNYTNLRSGVSVCARLMSKNVMKAV